MKEMREIGREGNRHWAGRVAPNSANAGEMANPGVVFFFFQFLFSIASRYSDLDPFGVDNPGQWGDRCCHDHQREE